MITVHHRAWGSYAVGKGDHLTALDIQYAKGVLDADHPLPAIQSRLEILPCAVFIYEIRGRTEYITYLAFDYARSSLKIWG